MKNKIYALYKGEELIASGTMLGLSSKATVHAYIKNLQKQGLVTTNGTRSIRIVKHYEPEDIDKILKDNLSEYHYKIVKEYYGY